MKNLRVVRLSPIPGHEAQAVVYVSDVEAGGKSELLSANYCHVESGALFIDKHSTTFVPDLPSAEAPVIDDTP